MTFGERIREARKKKRMSQQELAELSGRSRKYICRYEKDKSEPMAFTLGDIAKALGVSTDYLIFGDDENGR